MINSLRLSLLLAVLTVTTYYVVLHSRVLRIDHPITQDEPVFVEITAAPNPYTLDGVVNCANVYGPGYALWARPFAALITNPYIAHRWASTSALCLMLGLLGWVLRREGLGGIEITAGLGLVYILNVSSHSLVASADLAGAAWYFAALVVSRRGTWPALLAGLVLTAFAALTKPYFAFAGVIVASHLLFFDSPRKALCYLGISTLLGLIGFAVMQVVAPYYVFSTFFVQSAAALRRWAIVRDQSLEFALLTVGVLGLALLQRPARRSIALAFRQPLVTPAIGFWEWSALLATVVLLGALGWHPGNYLVYYYHLLLVPLVIVGLRRLQAWPRLGLVLLCVNFLVLGWLLPPQPGNDNWAALEANVTAVHGTVLADPFLEPLSRTHPNIELFSHGQTFSILQVLDQVGPGQSPAYIEAQRRILEKVARLNARIRDQEFAAIYISYQDMGGNLAWSYDQSHVIKTILARYRCIGEVTIYPYATPYWDRMRHGTYAHRITKWTPK